MSIESHYQKQSKENDSRGTPKGFWEKVGKDLGLKFDAYDPCSLTTEATGWRAEDGLSDAPEWVHCYPMNPPYSRGETEKWLAKARRDQLNGKTVVVLVKGDWTTEWYKQNALPYVQLIPVVDRIQFEGTDHKAPFSSMLLVYRPGIIPTQVVFHWP